MKTKPTLPVSIIKARESKDAYEWGANYYEVTIEEELRYRNPRTQAEVVWAKDSKFLLQVGSYDGKYSCEWALKMTVSGKRTGAAECLGIENRYPCCNTLKGIAQEAVNRILINASNREGTEGARLTHYGAERRFRGFGIAYLNMGNHIKGKPKIRYYGTDDADDWRW